MHAYIHVHASMVFAKILRKHLWYINVAIIIILVKNYMYVVYEYFYGEHSITCFRENYMYIHVHI